MLQEAAKKKVNAVELNNQASENFENVDASVKWSSEEQTILEKALRDFPSTKFEKNPLERWDKISKVVGRSKSEIKNRVKELQDMIQTKKNKK